MASDKQSAPVFSWQFLAVMAAGLGIFASRQGSLPLSPDNETAKASAPAGGSEQPGSVTDSRLWEDPYDAPLGNDSGQIGLASIPTGAVTIGAAQGGPSDIAHKKICVLPVIVRGDANSAEAHEMRIRFRMATVSGLGASGFVADDPNHLTWTMIQLGNANPEPVPTEWFLRGEISRHEHSLYDAVLVAWIRDSVLFTNPLEQLGRIRSGLESELRVPGPDVLQRPDFRVIGPYWSGTLVDMLNEDPKAGIGITFYSSSATMADGVLDLLAQPKSGVLAMGRKRLSDPLTGPVLINLTCDDEKLSESLINELDLRGVKPGGRDSRIAIISDWDTDYGRVLPLTFAAKLEQWVACRAPGAPAVVPGSILPPLNRVRYAALESDNAKTWPTQVLRAYYVSGVEGTLRAGKIQKVQDDSKSAPGSHSSAVSLQRAEGEHQVDYISRLGKILSQRISERNVGPGDNGKLVAIGVLGADVYDKLLLIQALRPIFRDALFFTDALDARFMDPIRAIPYTRNLVVAAPFGFDLFRSYQVGVPPFRSSEQTAAFLAVQAAVAMDAKDLDNVSSQLKPLRFEIGRTYPVALNIPDAARPEDHKSDLKGPTDKFADLLHPPQESFFPGWARFFSLYLLRVLSAIAAAGLFYITVTFVVLGRIPYMPRSSRRNLAIVISSVSFVAIIGVILCFYDGIEPATWIEGVSLWPSEFVRLAALATGVVGFFCLQVRVMQSREDLAEQFGLDCPKVANTEDSQKDKRRGWGRFGEVIVRGPQPERDYLMTFENAVSKYGWLVDPEGTRTKGEAVPGPETGRYIIVQALWSHFCAQSTVYRRNVRTLVMTGSFFLAWIAIGPAFGFPVTPFRGWFSHLCDGAATLASSIVLTYLMFWVVDETHICLRFVEKLGMPEPTIWPQQAYNRISTLRPALLEHQVRDNAASSFLDVCFIGKVTQEAVPLIVLPFVVLTLMIIARWNFFANWHWDPMILAIFGFDAAVCVCCAIMLRNAAVDAKERAIRQIGAASAVARAGEATHWADALDSLKALMKQNTDGAYKPWHQQPFVSAILVPFGGSGGLGLIEYLLSR